MFYTVNFLDPKMLVIFRLVPSHPNYPRLRWTSRRWMGGHCMAVLSLAGLVLTRKETIIGWILMRSPRPEWWIMARRRSPVKISQPAPMVAPHLLLDLSLSLLFVFVFFVGQEYVR